nr:retrovirus-related Pol polyprotein from transposon TNT 1-94 [Tanacetum cinerariifolium]GEZ31846.1 retrovirus-related Pol polyprotein from transposon TNT 1-94 [Tanacetum cinerariifolium]
LSNLFCGIWTRDAQSIRPEIALNSSTFFVIRILKLLFAIHDLEGSDLLKGSRGLNLYTLSLENLMLSSPICLLSKASKTKSWLCHQRLSHLNFDYINSLAKQGLVRGLPKLKYQKDHVCSACALADTPTVEESKQNEDPQGKAIDPTRYHGMIGTLMYLTTSRPVCMCTRYQAKPTEKYLHAIKRIFRYLRGSINTSLWYPKDTCIALTAFADADHVGCQDNRKTWNAKHVIENSKKAVDEEEEQWWLKFVRIGEDYQEYGLPIPDVMLTDAIKQSKSYQMFIKYFTYQIPPKKSRGNGSQGKKTADTPVEEVDVFEDSEHKPAKKRTSSKSIIQTEAEAAKKVHATHARIVTKQVPESARRRKSSKVTSVPPKTLKGVPFLTPKEQEAADIIIPEVLDHSTIIFATSSEGTGIKPGVLDEEKDITKEKVILGWGDEQDSEYSDDYNNDVKKDDKDGDADDGGDDHVSDTQDADDEDVKTEYDEDEICKYKIRVCKDEDEEMENDKV